MRNTQIINKKVTLGFITFALLNSACSPHLKQPVEDIESFRENAKAEVEKGPIKPQVIRETVIVQKPEIVIQEQAKIDDSLLILENQKIFAFTEGQMARHKIRVRHLTPKLTSQLNIKNMPKGMTIKKISSQGNQDEYELMWAPELYFINSNRVFEKQMIEIEVVSTSSDPILKNLKIVEPAAVIVTRQNQTPSNLEVKGLSENIKNSTLTKFSITVKVPGYNEKSQDKPILVISPDPLTFTPGVEKEWDASRHVTFVNSQLAKFIGNETWQFDLTLDTQNIPTQATHLPAKMRMLAKVFSPNGLSTASTVIRFTLQGDK